MEGSLSSGTTYSEWKAKRQFIADLVDHDGSILDIGCANGFFLRSLQEWSGRQLVPYGVDTNGGLIAHATELFPEYKNNFRVLDVRSIHTIAQIGLPDKYDFIFWNFLGYWRISHSDWQAVFRRVLPLAARRVILGFYGTNRYIPHSKEWQEERDRLLRLPSEFEKAGFVFSGSRLNPTNFNQVVGWIDRC